ncbi:hypothetical protein [Bradyrhizobium acaciae]|uniref:hypothetical protein n=1 Tax=Bradyrhizobium acaciae TaxID=2683706 RepID=UPI001E4EDC64|nr:hypothetical protein [Bradyrhizobium acaciae]MCC8977580.1 hypothetical protein [Bradyrhizobium acaciae]
MTFSLVVNRHRCKALQRCLFTKGATMGKKRQQANAAVNFHCQLNRLEEIAIQIWFRTQPVHEARCVLRTDLAVQLEGLEGAAGILRSAAEDLQQKISRLKSK